MAKTVKMCDMPKGIAVEVFSKLNPGKIQINQVRGTIRIFTEVEPKKLVYPEGWYYAKGTFSNKHTSSTGIYEEVGMYRFSGESWEQRATYCTLYD